MSSPSDKTPLQIERELKIKAIAEQNDYFRQQPPESEGFGRWLCSGSVNAQGLEFVLECFRAVKAYDVFTKENDPFGSHEMGFMEVQGQKVWWKIDLYNLAYDGGATMPTSLADTRRVLTVFFPSDH